MRDINLLQQQKGAASEFDARRSGRMALLVLGALLGVFLIVYAGLVILTQQNISRTQAAQNEAAKYQEVVAVKNELAGKKAESAALQELLKAAQDSGYIDTSFLGAFAKSMTDNAVLQSITMGEAGDIAFSSKAATRADITAFTFKLKETELFSDVALAVITQSAQQTGEEAAAQNAPILYDFTVKAVLKGGEAK